MLPRSMRTALLASIGLATAASPAAAFATGPGSRSFHGRVREPVRVFTPVPTSSCSLALPAAGRDNTEAPELTSCGVLLWSILGLSFAGATLSHASRESGVMMRISRQRRFKYIKTFGEGSPKTPGWVKYRDTLVGEDRKYPWGSRGFKYPEWVTKQKWERCRAVNKARSLRWFVQAHDKDGNWINKRTPCTVTQAVDRILEGYARTNSKLHNKTLECMMVLALNPKFPDQQVRCSLKLPHGTGKKSRVAVFCPEEEEAEVLELGAFKAGATLSKEIQNEEINFDILVAKPQMMPQLAKLGKILGPKRLMPSPKSGTVISDYAEAIKEFSGGGLIELRNDQFSNINVPVGRLSMGREELIENFNGLLKGLMSKRPAGAKKALWKQIHIGSTQSPSYPILESEWPKMPKKG